MSCTNFKLSKDELNEFHQNGYIGPFTLYTPDEMKEIFKDLRLKLLNTKAAIYQDPQVKLAANRPSLLGYDRHLDVLSLEELIIKKEIIDKLRTIMGENILCWRTELFPKYPGSEGTDWHQAKTFGGVTRDKKPQLEWPDNYNNLKSSITVWVALTESTVENGCLQFIPKTHKIMYYDETKEMNFDVNQIDNIEKAGIKRGLYGFDFRKLQIDPNWKPDESKAVSIVMQPGQFVIFCETLMHASHAHKGLTESIRVGLSARYVPTCVKIYPHSKNFNEFGYNASLTNYRSILVSGIDEFKYNNIMLPRVYSIEKKSD